MTLRRYSRYFKLIFLIWDLLMLNAAYVISYYLRYSSFERFYIPESQVVLLISNVFWIVITTYQNSYQFIRVEHLDKILMKSLRLVLIHLTIIFTLLLVMKYNDISRLRLVYFYALLVLSVFFTRTTIINLLKLLRKHGYNYRNVIIIGNDKSAQQVHSTLVKDLAYGFRVLGFFDDHPDQDALLRTDYLGTTEDFKKFADNNKVHEVYCALTSGQSEAMVHDIAEYCESNLIRIKFIPDFGRFTKTRRVFVDMYGQIPVVMLRKEPLEMPFNRIIKRSFDFIFAILVIAIVFPIVVPILAIIIKLSSKGPVFFRQQRSGENNKTFWCWKFRTMHVNKDADKIQATKNDSRVTGIGKFMRKTNLDEIPQFLNVLRGNMSVIGPRPHMLKHTEEYRALIKNYLVRHFAKPGLSGWAQVNGFRGETKNLEQMRMRVEYDIWYIENWTFLLDLKIIFKTTINMFKGEENAA